MVDLPIRRAGRAYKSVDERINKLVNDFQNPSTRELVSSWVDEQIANGINPKTVALLLYSLYHALNALEKPIPQIIKENDKETIVRHLKRIAINGRVIRKHKLMIKRFFRWVNDGEHPKCTKWISLKKTLGDMKPEIQLLTDEEKKAILHNALNQRDRTTFSILLENPTRPKDMINLNIKDITANEYGYEIKFHSKTQQGFRTVQFIHAAPEIRLYLSGHRWKDDPEAPMFYSNANRHKGNKPHRLGFFAMRYSLKEACRRAGIKRNITLYHFRKTVTSELLQDPRYTPKEVQVLGGWANISTMFDTYGKVTSEMVNKKKLIVNGKIKEDDNSKKETVLKPIKCPRCGTENPEKVDSCMKCWLPLTRKGAMLNAKNTVRSVAKFQDIDENDRKAIITLINKLFDKGIINAQDFV